MGDLRSHAPDPKSVVAGAVDTWGSQIFGAPMHLATLIKDVAVKDDVLHRVFTEVVRRELLEERGPAIERSGSTPRTGYAEIDAFAHSPATLRIETEHVTLCAACKSTGREPCPRCHGSASVPCSSCAGAGRARNPKTNRLNKCKTCGATGVRVCGECASGQVPCRSCLGSGHQRAWLVYIERREGRVAIEPQTFFLDSPPQLSKPMALSDDDLGAFDLQRDEAATGPLDVARVGGDGGALIGLELSKVDPRLERVVQQQYLQLTAARRHVTYEMCGTTGTLVLFGRDLVGSPTRQALHPIQRRLAWWTASVVVLAVLVLVLWRSLVGRSAYYAGASAAMGWCTLGSVFLSIPWLGGLLRSWKPGPRLTRPRFLEVMFGGAWLATFAAMVLMGLAARPTSGELRKVMALGDLAQARRVVEALREVSGNTHTVREADDQLLMAEAEHASAQERLSKLDEVVAHQGSRAAAAASSARTERLAGIRALVDKQYGGEAVQAIDRSFGESWRSDPEIAELRARAYDAQMATCLDDPCRLQMGRAAQSAHETPARLEATRRIRDRILNALASRDVSDPSPITRVRKLSELQGLSRQALALNYDAELTAKATEAGDWAGTKRDAIAIIGADREVVAEIFPGLKAGPSTAASSMFSVDHLDAYFAFDANGKCRGIYAVGSGRPRTLASETWPADRLLSQAVGHSVTVRAPVPGRGASTAWSEGGVKVVARWRDDDLVELRIGDASP